MKAHSGNESARFAHWASVWRALPVVGLLAACAHDSTSAFGNPERGRDAIAAIGCGSCHTIHGVTGANGQVGPSLNGVGKRAILAGELVTTPANMLRWIENPQRIEPGVAMPPLENVSEQRARDIVAYLYSLK